MEKIQLVTTVNIDEKEYYLVKNNVTVLGTVYGTIPVSYFNDNILMIEVNGLDMSLGKTVEKAIMQRRIDNFFSDIVLSDDNLSLLKDGISIVSFTLEKYMGMFKGKYDNGELFDYPMEEFNYIKENIKPTRLALVEDRLYQLP